MGLEGTGQAQGGSGIWMSVPITKPLLRDGAPFRGTCLRHWAKVLGSQTDLLTP